MTILLAMLYFFIFKLLRIEFIYVMALVFIFHYMTFATVHVLVNAKAKEYDVESDGYRIKNVIAIVTNGVLLVRFINSPDTFHWYFIVIPVVLDLLSILILKGWYINWKDTITYSILLSAKSNGYAIICATAFMYVDQYGIPIAILICFIIGFIASIINKISK